MLLSLNKLFSKFCPYICLVFCELKNRIKAKDQDLINMTCMYVNVEFLVPTYPLMHFLKDFIYFEKEKDKEI